MGPSLYREGVAFRMMMMMMFITISLETKARRGDGEHGRWGACFAGSSPPLLGRERAAVDVDVGPERRSPRCIQ